MLTKVFNMAGEQVGEIELSEAVFGITPNQAVVHEAVKHHLAACRQGSTRAPQWTHGGIVFAPKPRDYTFSMNKKAKRLALKSVLSAKAAEENVVVINVITMAAPKTKEFAAFLKAVGCTGKTLVVTAAPDQNVVRSGRNIAGCQVTFANLLNTYDVANADKLVVDQAALARIEEVFA